MTVSATSLTASVFDIQGFSLKDGPGIRTTVFFKGCPLRCIWCHNPESLSDEPQLMFHPNLCVGCMQCVDACKSGVHEAVLRDSVLVHTVDAGKCTGTGECIKVCCYHALSLVGQTYTPAALLERIRNDVRYFGIEDPDGVSTGGITFSGGEPMLQVDFITEFRALVPGMHIAIETSGFAPAGEFRKILPSVDLFLFDFKVADPARHLELCGVDNSLILENLDFLYRSGKEIVLRLPLIPGINDTPDHFDAIAALLEKYPLISRAEILPYHTLGTGKTRELGGIPHPDLPAQAPSPETVRNWLEELKNRGCTRAIVM